MGWVVKLQLLVGRVGLGQAFTSCANWWREESDFYCHIAHCVRSTIDRKSCFIHKA